MNIEPVLIIIIFSAFIFFGLLFLYAFYLGKFIERDTEHYKKYEKIISEAHQRAKVLLDQSSSRSQEIILEATKAKEDIDKSLKQSLDSALSKNSQLLESSTTELIKSHQGLLEEARKALKQQVDDFTLQLKKTGDTALEELKKSLADDKSVSEDYLKQKIDKEFERVSTELDAYKKAQLEGLKQNIDDTVLKISKNVVSKSISLNDHEKLVLEALNMAKKEGFFSK